MKYLAAISILIFALIWVPGAEGGRPRMPGAPAVEYGAYCRGPHGGVHKGMGIHGSIEPLRHFFAKRGLDVTITGHTMRFIRADIYNGTEFVDSIILDTRTGKMRSVY